MVDFARGLLRYLLHDPSAQGVLWGTVLLVLLVVAYYVVQKFRDQSADDQPTASDLLTNFRELHDQGDITEIEFRNIKTVLGGQLDEELTDAGEQT